MFFDLILLWFVNLFFPEKQTAATDGESSENWIILDELDHPDFSFREKMNQMKNEGDDSNCDWDDFDI